MSDVSAILSLPFIAPSQAQKHVTHNEALRLLDVAVQLAVLARDLSVPPSSPAVGEAYIVAAGGSGDWSGQEAKIAVWQGGEGWLFTDPRPGWRAYVQAESTEVVWSGTAWGGMGAAPSVLDNLPGVGIATQSDATNRLAVAAPATLLTHDGSDHQLKINKAALADTASLLFQTGWSGRAEMGLSGNDGFAVKVSVDGAAWATAFEANPVTGDVHLPQGLAVGGAVTGAAVQADVFDATPGRLLTGGAYGLGGTLPACPGGDLDLAPEGGFCAFGPATSQAPGSAGAAGFVRTLRLDGASVVQEAYLSAPSQDLNRRFQRVQSSGVWGGWQELYSQASALGPVSLSSGVPTGALMEAGSGAGGAYIRLADGTQICQIDAAPQTATTPMGALYQGGSATWTFPIAFAAPPVVTGQAEGGSWVMVSAVSASGAEYARITALSNATAQPIRLLAVGRWA